MTKTKKRYTLVWVEAWNSLKRELVTNSKSEIELGIKCIALVETYSTYAQLMENSFNKRVEKDHKLQKEQLEEWKVQHENDDEIGEVEL